MLKYFQRRLVRVNFYYQSGEFIKTIQVQPGTTLRDAAIANSIEVEGACGGKCACATCHMVLPAEYFKLLPQPNQKEADMLDLGVDVTSYSRLGCQVKCVAELEGVDITLPHLIKLEIKPAN